MPRRKAYKKKYVKKPNSDHYKLVKLEREVKKNRPEEELKFVDEYSAGVPIIPAGVYNTPLTPQPAQGSADNNRIGNEIFVKMYRTHLKITANSGVMGTTNVRCIHFIDKECLGALPDVFTSVSKFALLNNTIVTDPVLMPYNLDTLGNRYRIIKDKVYTFNPNVVQSFNVATGATTAYCPDQKVIDTKIKLNMKVKFVNNAGSIADIIGPTPFMLLLSDQAVLQPIYSVTARTTFTDA